jgi:hypothetical protein
LQANLLGYEEQNGVRCSVVGRDTVLQAGRSRVRIPMGSLVFFNLPNPSSLQQKLVPGIFLGGKGRLERQSDNLTAICEPIV